MPGGYFLWPQGKALRGLAAAPRLMPVAAVEGRLAAMFPSGHPVLCSSGRAALVMALIASRAARGDLVGVFPYASHCVLDAISRVATPLAGPTAPKARLRVVYHQWGFVLETSLPLTAIEDCVDTLCVRGADLFPGGGAFELWSLPKILGVTSGGVLWCRDAATAHAMRRLRDERGGGLAQWLLRLIGAVHPRMHACWQALEGSAGNLSRLQTGEIALAVELWDETVADRRRKLEMAGPCAMHELQSRPDRLPPVVPVSMELPDARALELGISAGFRRIELPQRDGSRSLARVLPIPIHQDVPERWLANVLAQLSAAGLQRETVPSAV